MEYYRISQALFRAWFANFVSTAVANATTLNLDTTQQTELTTANTDYGTSVDAAATAQADAKSATNTKTANYEAALALVMQYANVWQIDPAVDDDLKLKLGLTIRDTSPSPRPVYTISGLSASGNDYGVVKLRWDRNGNLPGCNFIVQASQNGGAWTFVTVTTKTRNAIGGQSMVPTAYRVITERRGQLSAASGSVNAYSESEAPTLVLLEDAA